jgi:hypothetical protein
VTGKLRNTKDIKELLFQKLINLLKKNTLLNKTAAATVTFFCLENKK